MAKFTKEMVDDYADKLLIGLSDEENKMVLEEFEQIDHDIAMIADIPGIEKIEPMNYALDNQTARYNDDETEETPEIDDLLRNAGKSIGREIEVVKVVG